MDQIKDHIIAKAINDLRDIAIKYHNTQQLREQIASIVRPLLQQSPAVAVPDEIPRDDYADNESKAHRRGWNDCREEMLRNIAKPSPRITEQVVEVSETSQLYDIFPLR